MYGNTKKSLNQDFRRIFAIIPATETRNLFKTVKGVTVIEKTLETYALFASNLGNVGIYLRAVIVANKRDIYSIRNLIKLNNYDFVLNVIPGGNTRTESVWKALEELDTLPFPLKADDVMFVHDADYCYTEQEVLTNCIEGIIETELCAPAILKDNKPLLQFPQVFRYRVLEKAYANAMRHGIDADDDIELAKRLGFRCELVNGLDNNVKAGTVTNRRSPFAQITA